MAAVFQGGKFALKDCRGYYPDGGWRLENLYIFENDYNTPDGTGVRNYIHVVDMAQGPVKALQAIEANCGVAVYN